MLLTTINRRLDAAFARMERAWAAYEANRNEANRRTYMAARSRCQRLHELTT